jgi:hypothetical protein
MPASSEEPAEEEVVQSMPEAHAQWLPGNDPDREQGLRALAMCGGSSRKAVKLLKESGGPKISEATLRGWLTTHKAQYDRIRAEAAPTLQAMRAEKFEAAADLKHQAALLIAWRLLKAAERVKSRRQDLPRRSKTSASPASTSTRASC